MHVVDATLFFSPTSGGVKRYLLAKHEWMRAHTRWRHSLVVPGEGRNHVPGGISTVRGGRLPGAFNYRLPLNPLRWSRAIEALEPDVIEVGDVFHPAWAAWRVARRRRIPLIAFYHSSLPQLAGRRLGAGTRKFLEWYVRLIYQRCALVLAPSRHSRDYLRSIGVAHAACQPLGVDLEVFHPSRGQRDLRGELGLPGSTRLLAFAGRFSAEKNIPTLTEAFRRLGRNHHLLLIGGDETRRDGNVTRIPYRRDNWELASYLASADAFVHAGKHETFGLVVLEAMACGRPVVALRAGALPELVAEGTGALAEADAEDPARDAASLADTIAALYERDIESLGAAARRHVETNYSWTGVFQGLMAHYQTAVNSRMLIPVPGTLEGAGTAS